MTIITSFIDVVDKPEWRPLAPAPNAHVAGGCICSDLRSSEDRHPTIFQLASVAILNEYHSKNDGWSLVNGALGLGGTFGAGAACSMMPSRGPRGVLAASTASRVVLSTALPASVGLNQLAGRGDGRGYKIRIIDNAAGGTGKVEERLIVANTSGTTPALVLDFPLTFTPTTGSAYEFLSGRVYLLSAGTVAGTFKYYDILTGFLSAALSVTNLPATIATDSAFVALDEGYVPCDATLTTIGTCQATASSSTSITITAPRALLVSEAVNLQVRVVSDPATPSSVGQKRRITASTVGTSSVLSVDAWSITPSATAVVVVENKEASGFFGECAVTAATSTSLSVTFPQTMLASEVVNLQVRVVHDPTNTTSVGQRRRITASSAPGVLTVAAWTVQPSTSARVVIENVNDLVLFTSATATTYTYEQEGNAWSTATYAARSTAIGVGVMAFQPFGVAKSQYAKDVDRNFRYTSIHSFRGGGSVALDVLDMHAAAAGTWSPTVVYGSGPTFTTGSCLVYDSVSSIGGGKFAYINSGGSQVFHRYNAYARQMNQWAYLRFAQGTAVVGGRMSLMSCYDGATELAFVGVLRSSGTELFDIMAQR